MTKHTDKQDVASTILQLALEATGNDRDKAADLVLGSLADRVRGEWAEIVRVMTLARGDGFADELPDDLQTFSIGDAHIPSLIVYHFADIGLDYVRHVDGSVFEVDFNDGRARLYAADGELIRSLETLTE